METRSNKTRIHALACETLKSIQRSYFDRWAISSQQKVLYHLWEYVDKKNPSDELILDQFEFWKNQVSKSLNSHGANHSIFIIKIKDFLIQAKIIQEIEKVENQVNEINNPSIKEITYTPEKISIKKLAIESLQSVKNAYDTRTIPSNRYEILQASMDFIDKKNPDDETIIKNFNRLIETESKSTGLTGMHNSVLIVTAKGFVAQANLVMELDSKIIGGNKTYNLRFSLLIALPRETLANILFYLDLKALGASGMASKICHDVINVKNKLGSTLRNKVIERIADEKKREEIRFYTSGCMSLYFKTLSSKIFMINVDPDNSILDVKRKYQYYEGVPPDQLRFIYAGKQLDDDRTLSDYNITRDSTISSVLKLRGD